MNKIKNNENIDLLLHETRIWLRQAMIKEHPDWLDEKGNCPKCDQFYFNLTGLIFEDN